MIIFLNKNPSSSQSNKKGYCPFSFKKLIPQKNTEKYQPKPLNWKKIIIVLFSLALIGTGIFLIWYYALRGKDYLDAKAVAPDAYKTLLVDVNTNKSETLGYANETIKQSVIQMTKDVQEIYKNGGFNQDLLTNYKYDGERTTPASDGTRSNEKSMVVTSKSSNDYLFAFIDATVYDKTGLTNSIKIYTKYLSHRVIIRITNGKIAAIGFANGEQNDATKNYFYLPGSDYGGL